MFNEELIQQVWEKARVMGDRDANEWRQDECGAWLLRDAYNHEHADFGWRIVNTSLGGPDTPDNLRPLHCRNQFDRANDKAHCHFTADRTGLKPSGYVDHPVNKEA